MTHQLRPFTVKKIEIAQAQVIKVLSKFHDLNLKARADLAG